MQSQTSQLKGQAFEKYNQAKQSATDLQGQLQSQALQLQNKANQSLGTIHSSLSKDVKLQDEFLTLIENLAEKGEDNAIHLLGNTLGVSVENKTPDQLVDEFNAAANNPETRKKLLQMTEGLIAISKKPLEEATTEAATLIGNTVDKEGKQAIKVGWDLAGSIPLAGEAIEAVKTVLDTFRAGEVAVDAAAQGVTVASTPVKEIENALTHPGVPVNTPILSRGGGAATEKQYNQYKKLQLNAANRLSQSFQGFYGTRKRRKGSKKRGPKIHMKTRTRRTKRAKY